jgi:hypothetical protein
LSTWFAILKPTFVWIFDLDEGLFNLGLNQPSSGSSIWTRVDLIPQLGVINKLLKVMVMFIIFKNLASALLSLRISPLLLIRIATIVLLYAVAILIFVIYIQSIGSGIVIFSGLFYNPELGISNGLLLSSPSSEGGWLAHHLLMSVLLPVKPCSLTQKEQNSFLLPEELKQKLGFGNEISDTWVQWFIGFAEGDGAILTTNLLRKLKPTFVWIFDLDEG